MATRYSQREENVTVNNPNFTKGCKKCEGRNPNAEGRAKAEIRKVRGCVATGWGLRLVVPWCGLAIWPFLRISGCSKFRVSPAPGVLRAPVLAVRPRRRLWR